MNYLGVGGGYIFATCFLLLGLPLQKHAARINDALGLLFSLRNAKEWPTECSAAPGRSVRNTFAVDQSD